MKTEIVLVKGFAITNQRETTLLWNKETGKPLHPALVWNDGRTASIVKELIETKPEKLDDLRVSTQSDRIRRSLLSQAFHAVVIYQVCLVPRLRHKAHTPCICILLFLPLSTFLQHWLLVKMPTSQDIMAVFVDNDNNILVDGQIVNVGRPGYKSSLKFEVGR